MKTIEVDEELYSYIASQTRHIGESASDILRRLLNFKAAAVPEMEESHEPDPLLALLQEGRLAREESAVARFMLILEALYHTRPEAFTQATEIKGRKRVYFARDPEELLANGKTTKPKPVPGTPFWVITNTNTPRKRNIIAQLMAAMDFPVLLIEQVCEQVY